jgi:uncharacterized membrane protein (UPF0127 family)
MKSIRIGNKDRPLPAPLQAIYCDRFICRLCGFMFRSSLASGEGLILVQGRDSRLDAAIHMLFVFMDLAVIWINSENVVVDTVLARAWHSAYIPRQAAKYILEIHPDRLKEFKIGDHIEFPNA